jgi:CHAD domain-containing protein
MTEALQDQEKTILEKVAGGQNEPLAKRATIILLTDAGKSAAEIAREVDYTISTIQRWQREFSHKGLRIFPESTLNGDFTIAKPAAAPPKPAKKVKTKSKKVNPKPHLQKSKKEVAYPTRTAIGLEPADTLAEAGRKVMGFHFARMLKHEPGTRQGEDIEALHDMRVATRRMRAAFRTFGQSYTKKTGQSLLTGLRATGRALGQVRDLDVFIEKLQAFLQTLPEGDWPVFQPLLDTWLNQREQARQEMMAYLDSKRYQKFKAEFLEFVTTPGLGVKSTPAGEPIPCRLRHLVPVLIYERIAAVWAYEEVLDRASLETLHQLRIAFKQLRYTLEFFEEILGQEKQQLITEIKNLQDHLGELNDAHVAGQMINDLLTRWDKDYQHLPLTDRPSPTPLTAYLNARIAEQQQLLTTFPPAWAKFNRPDFRRDLALAMTGL